MNGPFAMPIHVRIKSFNRPRHLSNLLMDLCQQASEHQFELDVVVFDDASTAPMLAPRTLCQEAGWGWVTASHNHGKAGAWAWHNQIYDSLRTVGTEDVIYFFDDDMRLCRNFFGVSLALWSKLRRDDKATLHLMVDSSRDNATCWTSERPRKIDPHIRRIQWVDGSFLCQRRMLDAIGFRLEEISASRWKTHPNRSTGVGQQLSHRLHAMGLGMYQSYKSLLVHASAESHYNPLERKKSPLDTVRFIDGNPAAKRLMRAEDIECSMATVSRRRGSLERVVDLVYDQVDVLRVYLNDYPDIPRFLDRPRIRPVLAQEAAGDLGDRGKFYWCQQANGYQLTIDDDIHYPANYVDRMLAGVERYNRSAVVGVHGIKFKELAAEEVVSYYKSRDVRHFSLQLDRDEAAHLVGTGTMAYHTDALELTRAMFPTPNMADIWVGLQTQAQRVPVVAIARPRHWMRCLPTDDSIFDRYGTDDAMQTRAVVSGAVDPTDAEPGASPWPWKLHKASRARGHHHERCASTEPAAACSCRVWPRHDQADATRLRRFVRGMKSRTVQQAYEDWCDES